ncbi:ABC transporter permease [Candidatus Bipolaricaulota bacterium]|nr:ABC transporter permease [Candidatus Bipolaricaulota bacterium]
MSIFQSSWAFMKKHFFKTPLTSGLGFGIVFLFLFVAAFGPLIAPYGSNHMDFDHILSSPSLKHPFGTDSLGRDILSRVMYGARIDLMVVLIVVPAAGFLGVILGTVAGITGGFIDDLIMRITDVFMSIPYLVLTMSVAAALGPSLRTVIIAMITAWWRGYARIARGEAISICESVYIEAAEAIGASRLRIIFRHTIPNEVGPILVYSTLDMGAAILTVAALSFLGYGVQPPMPEWGAMVTQGRDYLMNQWWLSIIPGLAIFTVVWGFNMVGDKLRDVFDPRIR